MPLTIEGQGTSTKSVFREGVLPVDTPVPSRLEAIEALGIMQRLSRTRDNTVLIDQGLVSWDQCADTLRRFILTR